MMRLLGLVLLVLCLLPMSAADAARGAVRSDWEQFLQPAPYATDRLIDWLGYQPSPEHEFPAEHYLITDLPPYRGGIDLFKDGKGRVVTAIFYLATGPIYTAEHVAAAQGLKSGLTLADAHQWYGEPTKRGTNPRSGGASETYDFAGDPKRSLTFQAMPGSTYIHRIMADRGDLEP